MKIAAVVVLRRSLRRNLKRNQVFRDRKNPLEMYDAVKLYDFIVTMFLTIVDELRNDLESPDMRQGSLPAARQVVAALRMYATGCFGGSDHRHRPIQYNCL